MEYEYRDREYLSAYSLDTRLFDRFGFEATDAAPIRSVFILTTDKGYKIFKKVSYGIDEIRFLHQTLKNIQVKYPYIINFKENTEGQPFIEYNGDVYVVFDLVDGRECMYENPIDVKLAAAGLRQFHLSGNRTDLYYKSRYLGGKLPNHYRKCLKELTSYRKIAKLHVNKSEFDSIYMDSCEYYIECVKNALMTIEKSNYLNYCHDKLVLCHHDLADHNIMLGNDNHVYFLDFDYAVIDLPFHDLSNFITKVSKKNHWESRILDLLLQEYYGGEKLSFDDKQILMGYMMFPVDFYDISKAYYMQTKKWEERDFIQRLKRKAGYREDREKMLEYFENNW